MRQILVMHKIPKIAIGLITYLLCCSSLFSQSWQWAKRVGSPGDNSNSDDEAFSEIKLDKAGNVYATGTFYSSTYFQNAQLFGLPTPLGYGQGEAYLMKFSPCGRLLWYRRMGGSNVDGSTSLIIDRAGHIVVLGYSFSVPSNYNGGGNSFIVTGTNSNGPQFLARFDTAGTLLNVSTYPSFYTKIFLRSQGDYLLTNGQSAAVVNTVGVVTSTMNFFPAPLPAFTAINDIKLDKYDNMYLCGAFMNPFVIAIGTTLVPMPSTLIANSNAGNSVIMKLNSTGVLQWYQRGYTQAQDGLAKIALDTSGTRLLTSGRVWNNCSVFGYSISTGVGTYANPIYRFNAATGSFISAITGTCSLATMADVYMSDRDNHFIMAGNLSGYLMFGNTTITASGGGPNRQSLYGLLDSTGNFISMSLLPQAGSNSVKERIFDAAVNENGEVYFCGMFGGTLDSLGTPVPKLNGLEDGFVGKHGFPCGSTLTALSPLAPSGLSAVYQGTLSNLVNWTDNSNFETAYELYYRDASPNFSLLTTLPANTTTYTHNGLNFNTNYCYKARAINNIGPSVFTNTDCAATPVQTAPQAPTNLSASNTGSLINNVNWIDNSFDESGFELWYHGSTPTFSLLAILPANTTNYLHSGLNYTTTYCYKALAINSVGASVFTNTDCATTPQIPPPTAPSTLVAVNTGSLENQIAWLDNSNNETSFELWFQDVSATYSLLSTLAANTTTYTHSGLSYTTTYCYKVNAVNAGGTSSSTNTDCASTPAELIDETGIAKQSNNLQFSIYPNPSKGLFTISFAQDAKPITIIVTDAIGRVVKEEQFPSNANTSNFKLILSAPPGLYFAKITSTNGTYAEKLIIE